MGMAASQARLLGLQARQSNLEYQGQQINQERTILSQQCTALYNSLLAMKVPTPPSTQDYTTIEYSGSDGADNFTIGTVKPSGKSFCIEFKTTETGKALQSDYGTRIVSLAENEVHVSEITSTNQTITPSELSSYYVENNGTIVSLNSANAEANGFKKLDSGNFQFQGGDDLTLYKYDPNSEKTITNPNANEILIGGNVACLFEDAVKEGLFTESEFEGYKEAIVNTFGSSNDSLKPEDFYVYIEISDIGSKSVKFALKLDVGSFSPETGKNTSDNFTKTYSFIPNGTFTKSDQIDGCNLTFDTQGRITSVSRPEYDTNGEPIGYRDIDLKAKTTTDTAAYEDAYNQYEYAQYEYDKAQQDINHKTEIIQQEDRNLELKLQRLDNERTMIKTEIEAVEKVIQENIESSYKTFNG